jgi:hypothetical protein
LIWMPSEPNTASNGSVNLLSRSRIAKLNAPARTPRSPDEAPGQPGHPTPRSGISTDTEDADTAYLALEDEENVDATETHQIDVKKVASQHGLGVCRLESAPGQSALRMGAGASRWRRGSCGSSRPRRGAPCVAARRGSSCTPMCGCRRPEARSTPRDLRRSAAALVPWGPATRGRPGACASAVPCPR